MSSVAASPGQIGREPHGAELIAVVLVLALANFLAVLDLTIANVLVPQIAGGLASSPSNGTWVITGYGVAEAIMVPLTGWLAERFGPVRVFVLGLIGFGVFSLLCGLATTLPMLILMRIMLGICGGPLIPLSQTLLIKVVPPKYETVALGVWSLTTILAPIAGPVMGGWIGDNWGWPWAFFVKIPLCFAAAALAYAVLHKHEQPVTKTRIDFVGLVLLVLWVGALQVMLGNGQDKDWFNSDFIVALLIVTVLGFISFVIWELTDKSPIVNLRIFADRSFSVSMLVIALAFGAMFGMIVLVPLWLQTNLGYTATWAGYNSALAGVTMLLSGAVSTYAITRFDHRLVSCIGLLLGAASALMRIGYNDQMTFWQLMWPQLMFGLSMPAVIIPLMDMSVSSLPDKDVASGAGQFNFIRTLASAISTAIVVALWIDQISSSKAILVGALHNPSNLIAAAQAAGIPAQKGLYLFDLMVQGQSVMLATNNTFFIIGIATLLTAGIVWLAPEPPRKSNGGKPMMH